jgi:rRNA processing protein Gar1
MTYIRAKTRGATMRTLGKVRGIGYDGKLIVKGNFTPVSKTEVFDNSSACLGRVVKVIGPVYSPYVLIKLPKNHNPSLDLVGKTVFTRKIHDNKS